MASVGRPRIRDPGRTQMLGIYMDPELIWKIKEEAAKRHQSHPDFIIDTLKKEMGISS